MPPLARSSRRTRTSVAEGECRARREGFDPFLIRHAHQTLRDPSSAPRAIGLHSQKRVSTHKIQQVVSTHIHTVEGGALHSQRLERLRRGSKRQQKQDARPLRTRTRVAPAACNASKTSKLPQTARNLLPALRDKGGWLAAPFWARAYARIAQKLHPRITIVATVSLL